MPLFSSFNTQNKLRIPLSAYASQIIEEDCFNFSLKKTTLINSIIINYYQQAECTISLRIKDYRDEIERFLGSARANENKSVINTIITEKANSLAAKYTKKKPADVNWQITLNKQVKTFLTEDSYTREDLYYGSKPGHYIRALLEEYTNLPYYLREEIVFKNIIDRINSGIKEQSILNVKTAKGSHIFIKPFAIKTDPLSMFHYLIGYNINFNNPQNNTSESFFNPPVMSIRISRLSTVEIQYTPSGALSPKEKRLLLNELEKKSVLFVSGKSTTVKLWLSDAGIRKYESQIHMRPLAVEKDPDNYHVYIFECTEAQAFFYFFKFGKDAKILYPNSLALLFKRAYSDALNMYDNLTSVPLL